MMWYPWQLFVKNKAAIIPLALSALVVVLTGVWIALRLRGVAEPIFLHYSVELGVDAVGNRWRAGTSAVLGVLIVATHTLWSNYLFLTARSQALVVAYATVPLSAALAAFAALVLRANGV